MTRLVSMIIAAAGVCVGGAAYAHSLSVHEAAAAPVSGPSRSQSSPDRQSTQRDQTKDEQAKKSRETPSHTEFGGQPRDQEARERHHQQYPESAQHLGPQGDEQRSEGAGKEGHAPDAVSGVGR
jgi:hypothetical protein